MKNKMTILLVMLFSFSLGLLPAAGEAETSIKSSEGVKAVLKTDPSKSMIDLFLSEGAKEITDAKVMASVTFPDGKKVEKELIGMKMGAAYSFMNSLDMSMPGRYSFDISIRTSGKTIKLGFTQNIP